MTDILETLGSPFNACMHRFDCCEEIQRLRAEVTKLRADAERYRWLQNAREKDWLRLSDMTAEDTEAAIDAARGAT